MSYYINTTIKGVFVNVENAVENALKEEDFGVLTVIDIQEKLHEKLDVEFRKYKILGACNPPYAYEALKHEDKIGTMLPCNVIIQEIEKNVIEVAAVDPMASMQAVNNEVLLEIAKDIKEKLSKVIKKLSNYSNSHFYL
jgi:uncharacterized protein (DUF302 family)